MNNCAICEAEEAQFNGTEYRCFECEGVIGEALGELNELEDEINPDDEFWAGVLRDELEEWEP